MTKVIDLQCNDSGIPLRRIQAAYLHRINWSLRFGLLPFLLLAPPALGQLTLTTTRLLNTNGTTDSRFDERPQVASDSAGNWVVVWHSGEDYLGASTDNDIFVASSTDNGVTWTAPVLLNTNATTDSRNDYVPQISTDGVGNWVVVWRSEEDLLGSGLDSDIFVASSADNGATWTAPGLLNTTATTDTGADHVPQISNNGAGTWLAVWQSYEDFSGAGTDSDCVVARSTDNGATWTEPGLLNTYATTDSGMDETPQVSSDGAGNWVAVWWSNDIFGGSGTDFDILVARSADNGTTWTVPVFVNSYAAIDSAYDSRPQIVSNGAGEWVSTWFSEENVAGAGSDFDILLSKSSDNGATWSAPSLLNSNATTDIGFDSDPELASDGMGNWIAVWQSSENLSGAWIDGDIFVAYSTDNCATWSFPELLNTYAITDSLDDIAPKIATDGNNNWVVVWYTSGGVAGTGNDYDIYVSNFTFPFDIPVDLPAIGYCGLGLIIGIMGIIGAVFARRGASNAPYGARSR